MRMSILLARRAVSGPAGMPDPQMSVDRVGLDQGFQAADLAGIPPDLDLTVIQHGNACRVIPTVFKLFQAIQDDRRGITLTDIGYDSTHRHSFQYLARRGKNPLWHYLVLSDPGNRTF